MDPDGTASALVLILLGAAFLYMLWMGRIRLLPPPQARKMLATAAALLVVYAVLAARAPRWVGCVDFLVIASMALGYLFLRSTHRGRLIVSRRKFRRTLQKNAEDSSLREEQFHGPVAPEQEARAAELEQLGFQRLYAAKGDAHVRIMLLRTRDGVAAEVTTFHPSTPHPVRTVELTSILLGWRGLFCTGDAERRFGAWAGELRQDFPGSDPADLVAYHEDGLTFLKAHGIEADLLTATSVPEAERWGRATVAEAIAAGSNEDLDGWAQAFSSGVSPRIGPLARDASVDSRLAAFWEAVNTTPTGQPR